VRKKIQNYFLADCDPMISCKFVDTHSPLKRPRPPFFSPPNGAAGESSNVLSFTLNTESRHCVLLRLAHSLGTDVPAEVWLGRKFRYVLLISDYDAKGVEKLVLGSRVRVATSQEELPCRLDESRHRHADSQLTRPRDTRLASRPQCDGRLL
jgi:hypothetical protein